MGGQIAKSNADSEVTTAGATGQESVKDTGLRFGVEPKQPDDSCAWEGQRGYPIHPHPNV